MSAHQASLPEAQFFDTNKLYENAMWEAQSLLDFIELYESFFQRLPQEFAGHLRQAEEKPLRRYLHDTLVPLKMIDAHQLQQLLQHHKERCLVGELTPSEIAEVESRLTHISQVSLQDLAGLKKWAHQQLEGGGQGAGK